MLIPIPNPILNPTLSPTSPSYSDPFRTISSSATRGQMLPSM